MLLQVLVELAVVDVADAEHPTARICLRKLERVAVSEGPWLGIFPLSVSLYLL